MSDEASRSPPLTSSDSIHPKVGNPRTHHAGAGCDQGNKEANDDRDAGVEKRVSVSCAPTSYQRQPTQGSDFTSLALESPNQVWNPSH